jgi:hypothetical protein
MLCGPNQSYDVERRTRGWLGRAGALWRWVEVGGGVMGVADGRRRALELVSTHPHEGALGHGGQGFNQSAWAWGSGWPDRGGSVCSLARSGSETRHRRRR